MKLLEIIKSKVISAILALWVWMKLKAEQWKLRDKAISLWEKAKAFYARMGAK
jgi:membrane fusion protein (multidrug efflux system)